MIQKYIKQKKIILSPIVNCFGFISFKAFMFIFSISEHVST